MIAICGWMKQEGKIYEDNMLLWGGNTNKFSYMNMPKNKKIKTSISNARCRKRVSVGLIIFQRN